MNKGCMAPFWGHLFGDTKISSFRGSGFKFNLWTSTLMFYDILFVTVSYGAGIRPRPHVYVYVL